MICEYIKNYYFSLRACFLMFMVLHFSDYYSIFFEKHQAFKVADKKFNLRLNDNKIRDDWNYAPAAEQRKCGEICHSLTKTYQKRCGAAGWTENRFYARVHNLLETYSAMADNANAWAKPDEPSRIR